MRQRKADCSKGMEEKRSERSTMQQDDWPTPSLSLVLPFLPFPSSFSSFFPCFPFENPLLKSPSYFRLAARRRQPCRPGLCVSSNSGTAPLICDVAVNGVATASWSTPTHQFAANTQPTLFVALDPNEPGAGTSQAFTAQYAYESGAVAYWSTYNETGLALPSTAAPLLSLNSSMICESPGWSNFSIHFQVAGFAPLTIQFAKKCSYPLLEIGTFVGDSNVMHNTKPVSTFSSFIYTSDVKMSSFLVYLNNQQTDPSLTQQKFTLTVTSSNPAALTVSPLGFTGWVGFAGQGFEYSIDVGYACSATAGVQDVPVYAVLNFQWSNPIIFQYRYRCGVGAALNGLTVGTQLGLADVAQNGRLIPPWNQTFHYTPDQTYDFTLVINSTQVNNVNYNVTIIPENAQVFSINSSSPTGGTIQWVAGVYPVPVVFLSSIICQNEGTARALVQLSFGNYVPVQMAFMYTCVAPLFNVGDGQGADNQNIIAQGVEKGWVGHATPDKNSASFYIGLDASSTIYSNPYVLTVSQWDGSVVTPTLFDPNNGNATRDGSSQRSPVVLSFNCLECVEAFGSQLAVQIYWGWANVAQIVLVKDCVVPEAQRGACGLIPEGPASAWTPLKIFFLVLFLLLLAACFSGCLYNRFKENKSGCDIIPCGVEISGCFNYCRGNGRARQEKWTPQEDGSYQSSLATSAQGHTNYSTNL